MYLDGANQPILCLELVLLPKEFDYTQKVICWCSNIERAWWDADPLDEMLSILFPVELMIYFPIA